MIPKICPTCSRHFYKKFPKQRICLICLNKKKAAKQKVIEEEACQLLQKLPEGAPPPIAPGIVSGGRR